MLHECCTSLRLRLPTSPFSRCLHHQPTELNGEGNRQLGQFRKCLSSGGDVLGSCPFERLSKAMVPTALQWSGWSLAAGNTGPLKT
eukprot:s65_g3.t1